MSELCEIVIHVTHFREKNKKNLFKSLLQANEREWSNASINTNLHLYLHMLFILCG